MDIENMKDLAKSSINDQFNNIRNLLTDKSYPYGAIITFVDRVDAVIFAYSLVDLISKDERDVFLDQKRVLYFECLNH